MTCRNPIVQYVPTRYDYKSVPGKCGQTGIGGDPVYCEACTARHEKRGHMPYECTHGHDMRPEGAFCSRCEFE